MERNRSGIPLRLLVSAAIVTGMLVLALVLISKSYLNYRDTLIAASASSARQLADNLDTHLQRLLAPIESTLELLTLDPLGRAESLEQRRTRLPVLARALQANPVLSAVYAGYRDGSFVLLRVLKEAPVRAAVTAPEQAHYLLQSVERDPQSGSFVASRWLFLDQDLALLEARDKPGYRFDPRRRPWFNAALSSQGTALTAPYLFFTTGEIGITLARRSMNSGTVIGVDASVNDLSDVVASLQLTPGNEMAVVSETGQVVAYPELSRIVRLDAKAGVRLVTLDELNRPALSAVAAHSGDGRMAGFDIDGERWYGLSVPLNTASGRHALRLLFAVPEQELLADAKAHGLEQLLWSGLLIVLLVWGGWRVGRLITRPLSQLTGRVNALAAFDFKHEVAVRSPVREVNRLGSMIDRMAGAIDNFQNIARTLARERDLDLMLRRVTDHLVAITGARAGVVYLYDEDADCLRRAARSRLEQIPGRLACGTGGIEQQCDEVRRALGGLDGTVLTTPLQDRNGDSLGVLALLLEPTAMLHEDGFRRFVDEVSGSAATAIETRRQVEAQQALLDAIIRLLADAIDAKSPYTSGHCERVPQLAEMLLDAAEHSDSGEFAAFRMSDSQRREFRTAAWLHDCGKITSPEYVVDKATKLETIYNRIHEVRTRFEVLWRDAEIEYLNGILEGGVEPTLREQRDRRQRELQEEFRFVAQANIGGEFMSDEAVAKLERIASRRWLRHFDNRLGLSREEMDRLPAQQDSLPVSEPLLADRPEHCVPWDGRRPPVEADHPDNIWGFDMTLPQHAYNFGELYNLSIRRGTLTDEERFIIYDHIVQTIRMLSNLPLPRELRRIPEIAGNHHEKVDGSGYPRRLEAGKLSLPERVMALADVFEALTAADRPYKEPKTLSESLRILAFMVRDRHLDAAVFRLFLESGAYLRYAEQFLKQEQIDAVDCRQLLAMIEQPPSECRAGVPCPTTRY